MVLPTAFKITGITFSRFALIVVPRRRRKLVMVFIESAVSKRSSVKSGYFVQDIIDQVAFDLAEIDRAVVVVQAFTINSFRALNDFKRIGHVPWVTLRAVIHSQTSDGVVIEFAKTVVYISCFAYALVVRVPLESAPTAV